MIKLIVLLIPAVALVGLERANAQSKWTAEVSLGTAHSFGSTLSIEQSSFPAVEIEADYETRPFEDAPYYMWRIGRHSKNHGWEIELIHHKAYLSNPTAAVQHFEISHGYNLLLANYTWSWNSILLRAGAGPVITHTEATVRGLSSSTGYSFTGPSVQFAVGRRFYITHSFFANVEGKFTASRARVEIAHGEASAPNFAIHALAGIGFQL
jgi:hypothetical protein